MKIKLIHKSGYHSKIENQNGNSIEIDNKSDLSPKGVSPMAVSYTHLRAHETS